MPTSPPYGPLMDCVDVRNALVEGANDPSLLAHAQTCEGCAELLGDDGRLARFLSAEDSNPWDGARRGAIQARLAEEPPAGGVVRRRAAWVAGVMVVVVWGLVRHRGDLGDVDAVRLGGLLLVFALAVGLALWGMSRPVYRPPLSKGVTSGVVAVAVASCVLPGCVPVVTPQVLPGWAHATAVCFGLGSAMATALTVLWWRLERRTLVGSWRWPLAALGSATVANAVLLVHCAYSDPLHLLVGHTSIGACFAAVGVLVSRR